MEGKCGEHWPLSADDVIDVLTDRD